MQYLLRDDFRIVGRFDARKDDRELITAKARDRIHFAHRFFQSLAGGTDQLIARIMAEGIVDFLEPVQIDKHQRKLRLFAFAAGNFGRQAIRKHHPVGKVGQKIKIGLTVDGLRVGLSNRYIARRQQVALFMIVAGQSGHAQFQMELGTVDAPPVHLQGQALAQRQAGGYALPKFLEFVMAARCHQPLDMATLNFTFWIPEHALCGAIERGDATPLIDRDQAIDSRFYNGPNARLVVARRYEHPVHVDEQSDQHQHVGENFQKMRGNERSVEAGPRCRHD